MTDTNEAVYWGTGRRKNAVARVRLVPGTGKVLINKRNAAEYLGGQPRVDMAGMPRKGTDPLRQEVRPQEGPQAPAVLQALIGTVSPTCSYRRGFALCGAPSL